MSTTYPVVKDGVPPLTPRQRTWFEGWISRCEDAGMHVPGLHALHWNVGNEEQAGRGHDVSVIHLDGERVAWASVDVYGNGSERFSEVGASEDEDDEEWG